MSFKESMQSLFSRIFAATFFIAALTSVSSQSFAACDGTTITNGQNKAWSDKIDGLNKPVTNAKNVSMQNDFSSPAKAQAQIDSNGSVSDGFGAIFPTGSANMNSILSLVATEFNGLVGGGGTYGIQSNSGSSIMSTSNLSTAASIGTCPSTGAPVAQNYRPST